MRPAWMASLRRSSVFRIAVLNAVLLTLAMTGAGLSGWFLTVHLVEKDVRARVQTEARALSVELAEEGVTSAADAIVSRQSQPGSLEYLLVDAQGVVRAGDLVSAPRTPGWAEVRVESQTGDGTLIVYTAVQKDGSIIAVADDMQRAAEIRNAVFAAIAVAGGAALGIAMVFGLLAARRTLTRMQRISETTRRVGEGDFSARVPAGAVQDDDIDELASTINAMLDHIDGLIAAVRRVSAEVAHDLKTPLTRVGHAVETARTATDVAAREEALAKAARGIAETLRLFDSMLELARLDAEGLAGHGVPLDLADVVQDVADAYRPEIEQSGRTFVVSVREGLSIRGDWDLLMRAISNLAENELRHSRAGARVSISLSCSDTCAVVRVADDGPGVDPADYAAVLRPFGRLDRARTVSGNGLGLAISAAVAQAHGGSLSLSDARPGLCVEMAFPLVREDALSRS